MHFLQLISTTDKIRKKNNKKMTLSEVMLPMHCADMVSTFVSFCSGKAGSEFFRSHTQSFPLTDCNGQIIGNWI